MAREDHEASSSQRLSLAFVEQQLTFRQKQVKYTLMIKDIPLHDAVHLLRQCSGVLLEGRYIEPHLHETEDENSTEFLSLMWEEEFEDEVIDIVVSFNEGDNIKVPIEGSQLTLVNSDGEEETLTLLREWIPEI
jgi:hypothetical protein